jgi:hypothetical protein
MLDTIHSMMNAFKLANLKEPKKDFPLILPKSWINNLIESQVYDRRLVDLTDDKRGFRGYAYLHNMNTHELITWEYVEEALQKAEKYDTLVALLKGD